MQTRPPDLTDDGIAGAVSESWGLPPVRAAYLPVGYGSHHWVISDATGRRWFASVDALPARDPEKLDRLSAALGVAVAARDRALPFVIAPVQTPAGAVVTRLPQGYALALYPYVDGRAGGFSDALTPAEGSELVRLLCSLHDVRLPPEHLAGVPVDTLTVPDRDRLTATLWELDDEWDGPFGDRLRDLLARHAAQVERAMDRHDALVAAAGPQQNRLVLTHGEPHPGNLLRTADGLKLIDWDTAMLAPPERDLWLADARTGGQAAEEYAAASGRPVPSVLLARYRLAWALADVAVFVDMLRHAPDENADTAWSWEALQDTLGGLDAFPSSLA